MAALQRAIVFIIVRYNDAAFLFLCQHVLNVIFDVGTSLLQSGIDVSAGEINDSEAMLYVTHHFNDL